jgi:hypothetical protein
MISGTVITERVRPNKWTALALLARTYLYTNTNKAKAEAEATEIISNTSMFSLSSLSNAFLKDPAINKEAIWQIQTVTSGWNTNDARLFILPSTGLSSTQPLSLNKRLILSFENNDARKTNWVKGIKVGPDSLYYAYKYKSATLNAPVTEYNTVFRFAEQFLIRAEARVKQNNLAGAIADLDIIRQRAGLPLIANINPGISQASLLSLIFHERQVELFTEWGHRWFDLKRTNLIDSIMNIETSLKGGVWQSYKKLYPIPVDELIVNPNLTQTLGY